MRLLFVYYLVFKVTPLINSVPYFKTPTRLDSIRTKRTVSFKAGLPLLRSQALGINWGTGQMGCLSPSVVLTKFQPKAPWGFRSAMQETWVRSLGQEDPLEKGMATHTPGILAWIIPWTEATIHGVTKSQTRLSY